MSSVDQITSPVETAPGTEPLPQRVDGKRANPPTPDGFSEMMVYPEAGIRVNASKDGSYRRGQVVAIQFADDKPPTSIEEEMLAMKGASERIRHHISFDLNTDHRQYERQNKDDPGGNLAEAKHLAHEIARRRYQEMGLSLSDRIER